MAKNSPREHIEEIRRSKFSIGGEVVNPLTQDLHHAVMHLSAELYTKDVHFLMELIQNAEDNEYEVGVKPTLEFLITSKDITATGAPETLLIFNNEKGFSPKNIDSICSVGRSTKKGNRKRGYIGEKGIGFKSVFLISSQPYIFSNGYQIKFSEEPCEHCNVGYVVPEWVKGKPTLVELQNLYGSSSILPTTTIVLPLKPDKVEAVQKQLSTIHPEILLFLSKIRQLSVREENEDPRLNAVSAISISKEINFITKKNMQAESYLLQLSSDEKCDHRESECSYHMWRQKFPVNRESKVDRRVDVDEWVITLAFPTGERLLRGKTSPGIYAFLPTEMITNFPFIIQADFLLASSRETILLDNKWNQGILSCVPIAFINAFTTLLKVDAPISSLLPVFNFLPIESSPYDDLNAVRESINKKLMDENIIPSESGTNQKFFHKAKDVSRLHAPFWEILSNAKRQGVSLHNISSHGRYILSCEFDKENNNNILRFLGVAYVDLGWYSKCIQSSDLVMGVSEDVYMDLLWFITSNWTSQSMSSSIIPTPLLKCVGVGGHVTLCSVYESINNVYLFRSNHSSCVSWLINWNIEFSCRNSFFLPQSTQEAITTHHKGHQIVEWLEKTVKVESSNVFKYAIFIGKTVGSDRKLAITYAHFLCSSYEGKYLTKEEIGQCCRIMPLVNNYGQVTVERKGVLVPARGSRWMQLIGSNPWRNAGFIELGEDYLRSGNYAGVSTSGNELLNFLKSYVSATDIPDLPPPDADLSCMSSLLTMENALLLLEWIRNIRRREIEMPTKFLESVEEGSWLKVSLLGSAGCGAPCQSFFPSSKLKHVLQNGFVDIAFIDLEFYGNQISKYKEELKEIRVMFEFGEVCEYIGEHLTYLAETSTLTKNHVLSILNFIKLLRENYLPPESFMNAVNCGAWLWTSQGYRSPTESVFYSEKWTAASEISNIPFIDQKCYGEELLSFKTELELLGVIFDLCGNYQLVIDNLKAQACNNFMTAEATLLILDCIRRVNSSERVIQTLVNKKCIKTSLGYKTPAECFLFDPAWGSLMQVFSVFPVIDVPFYGCDISLFKDELQKLGVVVNIEQASKTFCSFFRQQATSRSIGKDNVLNLLAWYKESKRMIPEDVRKCTLEVKKCISEVKCLKTRLGDYREPKECILHSSDWDPISYISLLPFIDDTYYGKSLHEYKEELQGMGVVITIRRGAKFVASGLRMPSDPSSIMPSTMFLLLLCVRYLQLEKHDKSLLTTYSAKLGQRWVKTSKGYKSPKDCLLFGSDWSNFLLPEDGPFVDEKFYGSLVSFKKELAYLGVTDDVPHGCHLIFANLCSYSNFSAIQRIYKCLSHFKWEPTKDDVLNVWIPNGDDDGMWVSPEGCTLYDKSGLFEQQLHVLEKFYEKDLLIFFTSGFGVKSNPCLNDYCKLWSVWEDSGCMLSDTECSAFWEFVVKHQSSAIKLIFFQKLPVYVDPVKIKLVDKHNIFIADDLCLKDLFEQSTTLPLFVWYPPTLKRSLHIMKLNKIYQEIGVRTLSESVQVEKINVIHNGLKEVDQNQTFIRRGVFKLILGFLASPSILMEVEKRHEVLTSLLKAKVFETSETITLTYKLQLSSGESVYAKASQMMIWGKSSSKIYVQKLDRLGSPMDLLQYATCASNTISKGLLWDKEANILQLADLLTLAFLLEFDEAAIDMLMKSKNLEILPEDEGFLGSAFPST